MTESENGGKDDVSTQKIIAKRMVPVGMGTLVAPTSLSRLLNHQCYCRIFRVNFLPLKAICLLFKTKCVYKPIMFCFGTLELKCFACLFLQPFDYDK